MLWNGIVFMLCNLFRNGKEIVVKEVELNYGILLLNLWMYYL